MRKLAAVIICLVAILSVAALRRRGGRPQSGSTPSWLGVQVLAVDRKVSANFNLACRRGLLVRKVVPGSPAERAGLVKGDVIRRIGSMRVSDTLQLKKAVDTTSPGQRRRIVVMRGGARKTIYVTMEPRPYWPAAPATQHVHGFVPVASPPVNRPYPYFYFGESDVTEDVYVWRNGE